MKHVVFNTEDQELLILYCFILAIFMLFPMRNLAIKGYLKRQSFGCLALRSTYSYGVGTLAC